MTSPRRIAFRPLLASIFVALLAVEAAAQAPTSRPVARPSTAGWWDDAFEEPRVALAEALRFPQRFRGRTIRVDVQFSRNTVAGDAFHTKFRSDSWMNFAAWADEARLWLPAEARSEHAFFFIRRASADAAAVRDAPRYSRFTLRIRVDDAIKGVPWVEVMSATPLVGRMNEASLMRLDRAVKLREARRYRAAAEEFLIADDPSLPVRARVAVQTQRVDCLESAGDRRGAFEAISAARLVAPDDVGVASTYARLRAALRSGADPVEERPASFVESLPASRPAAR